MIKLPYFSTARTLATRTLHPRTRWGRTTLGSGTLSGLLVALTWITRSASGSTLRGWAIFVTLIFAFCATRLSFHWARQMVLWRLRHRLIVTYIFIGVIPILLLLLIVTLGSYLLTGQFATYVAISDFHSDLQHLEAGNDSLAAQLRTLSRSRKLDTQAAGQLASVSGDDFPQRTVTVWQGEKGFSLTSGGTLIKNLPANVHDAIKGNFSGFVNDGDTLYLRAVKRYDQDGKPITVISSVPITPELVLSAMSDLGSITLIPPDPKGNLEVPPPGSRPAIDKRIMAGRVPPPAYRIDPTFTFFTLFSSTDWNTGKSQDCAIGVVTRPSTLYRTLFATLGNKTKVLQYGMLAIAILLGLVELVALYIGIRLTRSVTLAVAELYDGTEHVNRGDLTHRIHIRGRDQMAALEKSFNSMTESLVTLVAEQKQKQRMETELAFAYEVQDLLFPHKFTEIPSLDVYGVCRPARSVSGDYYDFIPIGDDRLMLAVGDISGKGISAALLMATVHAFVRAYSLEPALVSPPATSGAGLHPHLDGQRSSWENGASHLRPSPGTLLTTLNYQLFRCTPPEKYATMFLGFYDATSRELVYCNAGHLPPILIGRNGTVSRLDTPGMVVGLFDGETYGESSMAMHPGDLFVAFSDGITEPENDSVEFGEERLIALIQQHRTQPLAEIAAAITNAVLQWIGNAEQPDDITVVLARAR